MAANEDVYCTLVMNDAYLPGAAVLAHSLRDCGTQKKLACMVLQDSLSAASIQELQSLYNYVIPVARIGNPHPANLYLMNRPDLLYAFTKINVWRLTQFRKIVYLDADVVVLRAPEELFNIQEPFAAAPDVGWPDAFNTGVMVLSPHEGEFNALHGMAQAGDSFDGADQGLLNQYYEYRQWKRISFTYNTTPSANYQYEPAYRYYKRDISIVHFIGAEKPWARGRTIEGAPGAFQEMLSRWWAVYDRHFSIPTIEYAYGKVHPVQTHVHEGGHQTRSDNYYATGYPVDSTQPAPAPQSLPPAAPPPDYPLPIGAPSGPSTAPPMTEPGELAENIDQGIVEPPSTAEQRRFTAPQMEWDATRAAPPSISRPEAANFPTQVYEFNNDPEPFRPPGSYPDPPKDMWYKVPEKPKQPEKLKPLFPWEEHDNSRPTRRFVEDQPPERPAPLQVQPAYVDELEVGTDAVEVPPITPAIKIVSDNPWEAFSATKNAWDEVGAIDNYVRALTAFQRNRGKIEVLSNIQPSQAGITSPPTNANTDDLVAQVEQRRQSLILTDFPSAIERPSLPVTPAPIRRPTFWGDERGEDGQLPPAEGVPEQSEWDPNAQLEQLRRSSLLGPADPAFPNRMSIPERKMPATAAPIPEEVLAESHVVPLASIDDPADGTLQSLSGAGSPHDLGTSTSQVAWNITQTSATSTAASQQSSAIAASANSDSKSSGGSPSTQPPPPAVSAFPATRASRSSFDGLTSPDATDANTAFNVAATTTAAQRLFSMPGFQRTIAVDEADRSPQDKSNTQHTTSGPEAEGLFSPTSTVADSSADLEQSNHKVSNSEEQPEGFGLLSSGGIDTK